MTALEPIIPFFVAGGNPLWVPREPVIETPIPKYKRKPGRRKEILVGEVFPSNDGTILVTGEHSVGWLNCLVNGKQQKISRSWILELKRRTNT
jgi:hypothetical protein